MGKIEAVRLKLAQIYEYERGKGEKLELYLDQLAGGTITKAQFEGWAADVVLTGEEKNIMKTYIERRFSCRLHF